MLRRNVKAREIAIFPYTRNIVADDVEHSGFPLASIKLGRNSIPSNWRLLRPENTEFNAWWLLHDAAEQEDGNLELCELVAQAKFSLQQARSWGDMHNATNMKVTLPFLTNTARLPRGMILALKSASLPQKKQRSE